MFAKRSVRGPVKTVLNFPAQNKVGLGLSASSLGLGIYNTTENNRRTANEKQKLDLEAKSLTALTKIHKALEKKDET